MQINKVQVHSLLTKSNLPDSDYVINPYVGCPHGCVYCYASFMKRFTKHPEALGTFLDVKECTTPLPTQKLLHKRVFLSSVTDCYNPYEETYGKTQAILKQLIGVDCTVSISTKSSLILRDIKYLKQLSDVTVSISINTLDEEFKNDMDAASSIKDRLHTLQVLHEQGITTILFLSPIFPMLTDVFGIISRTKDFVDAYWFENLNLRGSYKKAVLDYIAEKYPQYTSLYEQIYKQKNMTYWQQLAKDIHSFCDEQHISYQNYFYHEKLVSNKRAQRKVD